MDQRIVLAPELGISADDFAAAWNAWPAYVKLGSARTEKLPPQAFDPFTSGIAFGIVIGLATNLARDFLYDRGNSPSADIIVTPLPQPDGTTRLIVHVKQE